MSTQTPAGLTSHALSDDASSSAIINTIDAVITRAGL
jgi:hypothetical protein